MMKIVPRRTSTKKTMLKGKTGKAKETTKAAQASNLIMQRNDEIIPSDRFFPSGTSHTPPSDDSLSPADLHFLKGSHCLVAKPCGPVGLSSPFDDSWPSSDLSTYKSPEGAARERMPEWAAEVWDSPSYPAENVSGSSEEADEPSKDGSVIAKYIDRFRHGRPSSRKERSAPVLQEGKHFWWLQSSLEKNSSAGEYGFSDLTGKSRGVPAKNESLQHDKVLSLKEDNHNTSLQFENDQETLRIQERASRLLQRSESSFGSTVPVSSEGLGSSPLSCTTHSDEEVVRRPYLLSMADYSKGPFGNPQWPTSLVPYTSAMVIPPCRPDEDILFQWRLRRKMEQARDGTLPVSSRRKSLSPPVRLSKQVADGLEVKVPAGALQQGTRADTSRKNRAAPSSIPLTSNLATGDFLKASSVPPHQHHFCDILPCPHNIYNPSKSRTETMRGDRGDSFGGTTERDQRQKQPGYPQEASPDEKCESSLDLTPIAHSQSKNEWECHTSSVHSHRKRSPQNGPPMKQQVKGHSDVDSSERRVSQLPANRASQRDQDSSIACQEVGVPGKRKEKEKHLSSPNAKSWKPHPDRVNFLCDAQEEIMNSRGRSDGSGALQKRPNAQESAYPRVTEGENMPKGVTSHHRAMERDHMLKEKVRARETMLHITSERESMPKEWTTAQKTTYRTQTTPETTHKVDEMRNSELQEVSSSHRERQGKRALPEKAEGRDTAHRQEGVRDCALVEESGAKKTSSSKKHGTSAGSPIHSILGQVISERLFSPPASPNPIDCKSKRQQFPRNDKPSPTINSADVSPRLEPLEVATQLLDDAEDSDGTEFADDPLLQVLRERRNAILRRLRDVDCFVTKLQAQTPAEHPEPN